MQRICKKKGIIEIKVPHGELGFVNLEHRRMFFLNCFESINFSGGEHAEKQIELVYMKLYIQETGNTALGLFKKSVYGLFLKIMNVLIQKTTSIYDQTLLRHLFPKTCIHVKFKKIK